VADDVDAALLPSGPPDGDQQGQFFELYKMMVQSSEALVGRRQGVNTFFLTANGAILTAIGLIVQGGGGVGVRALAVIALVVAGGALAIAWRTVLKSFGQLNTGKFAVINRMEPYLSASIYSAEWKALKEGRDPKTYRTFTSRETWVPTLLAIGYLVTLIVATVIATGAWRP
jgi:hypothetical protein